MMKAHLLGLCALLGSGYVLKRSLSETESSAESAEQLRVHRAMLDLSFQNADSVHSHRMQQVVADHTKKMSMQEAWEKTRSKNVKAVALIEDHVKNTAQAKTMELTEDMIDAARGKLNEELVEAYKKLDEVMAKCSNSWKMNKAARDAADVDTRNFQLSQQEAQDFEASSETKKVEYQQAFREKEESLNAEEARWGELASQLDAELQIVKDDMAVNMFILSITGDMVKNPPTALLQKKKVITKPTKSLIQNGVEYCLTKDGKKEWKFTDPQVQAKLEGLQAKSRQDINKAFKDSFEVSKNFSFAQVSAHSFLEKKQEPAAEGGEAAGEGEQDETVAAEVPDMPPATETVEDDPFGKRRNCAPGDPARYGYLHDRMSMLFGEAADMLIDLQRDFNKQLAEHNETIEDFKDEMDMYTKLIDDSDNAIAGSQEVQGRLVTALGETAKRLEELEELKKKMMAKCEEEIDTIMKDEVCGVKAVRDAIQMKSVDGLEAIQDCVVREGFVESDCEKDGVSHSCSDEKPPQGGTKVLTRDIFVEGNEKGARCPILSVTVPCGENPCPVDCKVSDEELVWSECNKLCNKGGPGEQMATRKVETWPKHGGAKCPVLTDSRPCNLHPCDVDCVLGTKDPVSGALKPGEWSEWSGCSRACSSSTGGGKQERRKNVLVEPIGEGTCAGKWSLERRESKECNTEVPCIGDEVCQANMDLVILIDSSGSVGEMNFKKMVAFLKDIAKRFAQSAFGQPGLNVAAIQYGNGFVENEDFQNPIISGAEIIQEWTNDFDALTTAVEGVEHARGFTNLAQAYIKAKEMFEMPAGHRGARIGAAFKKVIVLTDGTVSFKREAEDAFEMLDNAGIRVNAVIFSDTAQGRHNDWTNLLTRPVDQSLVKQETFAVLNSDKDREATATAIISSFCPVAESPSMRKQQEVKRAFKLIREDFDCLDWIESAVEDYSTGTCINGASRNMWRRRPIGPCGFQGSDEELKDQCADYVRNNAHGTAFVVGVDGLYRGACFYQDDDAAKVDDCLASEVPWAMPGAEDGYTSTAGIPWWKFNVYELTETSEVEVGSG